MKFASTKRASTYDRRRQGTKKETGRSFSRLCRLGLELLEDRRLLAADFMEDNDTFATASVLATAGSQTILGLNIEPAGDNDYYRWTAAQTGGAVIDLLFSNSQGDIDLEVLTSGGAPIASSNGVSNRERVSIDVVAGQQYVIRAFPVFLTGVSPNYTLAIQEIPNDAQESNNDLGSAVDLGSTTPSIPNLSLHSANDEDYFRFVAPGAGALNVDATFVHANGNVDVALLDEFGAELLRSSGGTNNEHLTASLSAGQIVYVRVFSEPNEPQTNYSLDFGFGQTPTIGAIGTQTIFAGQTLQLPLSIADADTPLDELLLSATSDNPTFLPTGGMRFDTSGATPTLIIPGVVTGFANVTVTVRDAEGGMASESFLFRVLASAPNFMPTISNIANQTVSEGSSSAVIPFTVNDLAAPPGDLVMSATTSDPTLLPAGNIVFGGSGSTRNLQIFAPAEKHGGPVLVTVTATDAGGLAATDTFLVTITATADVPSLSVSPASGDEDTAIPLSIFAALVDTDGSEALSINVSGVPSGATLSAGTAIGGGVWTLDPSQLAGLSMTPPPNDDADFTLFVQAQAREASNGNVALSPALPLGVNVAAVDDAPTISLITSKATAVDTPLGPLAFTIGDIDTPMAGLTLTAASSNQAVVANAGLALGGSGANRTLLITPVALATGTTTITLTLSDGTTDTLRQFAVTVGGANTLPTISSISNRVIDEDESTAAIAFTVGDAETTPAALVVFAASSNPTLVPEGGIVIAAGAGGDRTVQVTPAPNQTGTVAITLTVDDGQGGQAVEVFNVTVQGRNDAPTISQVDDIVLDEDVASGALSLVVGDEETSAAGLIVTASSNNTGLIPNANIQIGPASPTGATRYVIVTPAANASGVATITLSVSDGVNTTTETFDVTVNAVEDSPTITPISNVSFDEGTTFGPLAFTIGDGETPASALTVTVTSANQALIPNDGIVLGGSGANRTLTLTSLAGHWGGPLPITIAVSDGVNTTTQTFQATVLKVNHAPHLDDVETTIFENTANSTVVLDINDATTGIDRDIDGTPLFYSIIAGNPGGAFTINSSTGEIIVVNNSILDFEGVSEISLTVRASDANLTDTAVVTINLADVNEAPAVADATFSAAEGAAVGTTVGTLAAVDPDAGQTVAWAITAGNTGGAFAIDATGKITVANPGALNFQTTPTFSLTVQATDNGLPALSDTATVTINLTNVNDPPVVNDATFPLAENSTIGTVVGTVAVSDPDPGQTHSWLIISGNASGAFAIDATGKITVASAAPLNFEATTTFVLTVQATDNGSPALSDTATVTVNLTNVNEAPAVPDATFSLAENSAVGATVGTLALSDPDAGQSHSWLITAGNTGGAFAIDATGKITVASSAALNFEVNPTFTLTVQATDNGTPALSDTATVTINLTNVNEAPTVANATFSLAENSPAGTTVGTLVVSDPDAGQTHAWSIIGGNTGGAFAIDATGKITVAGAVNFETNPSFTLTVQATDSGSPALFDTAMVTINVTNVNEAPTVADATFSLAENSAVGTTVGTLAVSDPDAGQSHSWSITAGNTGGAFAIDATGKITVASAGAINFETNPTFTLTVQATDNGSPALSDTATVTINLTNVNEAPNVADATFSVAENSPAGTTVGTLAVSDPDAGQTHTWSITGGNNGGAFAIDATGKITVASPSSLNFETTPTFTLTVQATDNGSPALFDTAMVTIHLTNVNEAPNVVNATFSLAENSSVGTTVGTLAVSDPDAGQTHAWSITAGNTGGAFAIDATGKITVATGAAVNFETNPTFTLTVQATDNGSPALSDTATVTINLTNVNEAPIVADGTFSLAENSAVGTTVGTVGLSEPDAGQTHAWSITAGNTGGAFAIDATGKITVATAAAINFETNPTFTLTVQATDNGTPALSDTATVTINLTNVNEAPTVADATFSLAENSAVGTTVGTVGLSDPDAGQTHAWSITGGNTGGAFAIDATGKITVASLAALNFEATPTFTLTVQATDSGTPALSDTATVTINLTNVNEAPTVADATFSLAENSAVGTTVGTLAASDPDAGQTRSWSITAGNGSGAFAIDATGKITVASVSALNFETNPTFVLTVQATDNGTPALSDTAAVTINLTNVNEAPTVADATFSIAENSSVGTTVGTLAVTDPEAGQTHAWSITGGNAGGAFAIDATGKITVASTAALNFEATPTFTLTVQATDSGTPALSDTATVTINLTNVNEAPAVADATFSVAENSSVGTTVGTLAVSDPDSGQTHAWSITGGNAGGAFAIDATGKITVAAPAALNFETTPTFTLTVQATDSGSPALSDTATVTINLTNVNEAPSVADATFSVAENSSAGTTVGTLAVSDPDAGQTHSWSITAGNTGGAFAIDATGKITVASAAALNFEATPTFTLTVQATDSGSPALSDTATVTINLTNVNEAPSVADATLAVAENSPNGTVVGGLSASDPDAGQTHAWSITAGNTGGAFAIDAAGQITVANAAALDFDVTPVYTLTVQATDNGSPALSDTATVTIQVSNVNHPPAIANATFSLAENSPAATTVGTLAVTDADPEQTHSWSITAGNTGGAFAIDATGKITVASAAAINFETNPTFTLTVQVTDNGSPALSDTATVTVNLTNVNEAPAVADATFSIAENSSAATTVGTVGLSDPDAGQTHAWSITGGNTGGAFAIDAAGKITVASASALNFEANPTFTLTVQATDSGSPGLSDTATVTINLTNVNEAPTVADATFTLAENSAVGATVGTLAVSDPDAGQTHAWSITGGNAGGAFAIDATGKITVASAAAINFETNPTFVLTVQAADSGSPAQSDTATVTINLTNVNEAPTVADATFAVPEHSAAGTVVGTLSVTDPDAGQTHAWSITGGNTGGAFAIDATGKITVATPSAANFETTPTFTLTVQATDNGSPAQSDTATVTINLFNLNEAPAVGDATFSVAEHAAVGTTVGTLSLTDPDAGQTHAWQITGGNTSGAFAVDATGKITVANSTAIDFATNPSFMLIVRATDNGSPALFDVATVTIHVANQNDPPAVADATFSLAENSAVGATVGTLSVSDPDAGQTHSWSITGGNTGGAFAIDATGKITVASAAPLNFEATPTFVLTVQVTDNGAPALSDTATVTINLTNVNETPMVADAAFAIAENSAAGATVGALAVSDPDAGQSHAWSITGGNASGAFAIDATGKLTVANSAALNFEATPTFTLTVQATDNGSPALSDTATVTITLNNVNEAPTVADAAFSVSENASLGAVVGTLTVSDPDAGQTHAWSITGGNTGGAFAIDATGKITVAGTLSFETTPSYTLTVRATDNGSPALSDTATVTIQVLDVAALSGDYDSDGDVDGGDLTVWKGQFGSTGSQTADDDNDGDVDGADFLSWQRNFGASSSAGANTSATSTPGSTAPSLTEPAPAEGTTAETAPTTTPSQPPVQSETVVLPPSSPSIAEPTTSDGKTDLRRSAEPTWTAPRRTAARAPAAQSTDGSNAQGAHVVSIWEAEDSAYLAAADEAFSSEALVLRPLF